MPAGSGLLPVSGSAAVGVEDGLGAAGAVVGGTLGVGVAAARTVIVIAVADDGALFASPA